MFIVNWQWVDPLFTRCELKCTITRTLGAAGPLVLAPEEGMGAFWAPFFVVVFFAFFVLFVFFVFFVFFGFLSFLLLSFVVFFSSSFFVFFYFCLFCHFCLVIFFCCCYIFFLSFLSFSHHYHNHGVNIYYHTNLCSNPTIFQFYHTFHHKPLLLLPPPSGTHPHHIFCT